VLLFNDRLAYRPLYYSTVNQRLCFASEQKAVMALNGSSASFDVRGILSLFAFGHHLDGRTLFDNVKALPQASIAEYDPRNDKLAVETYWRPQYVSLNNHISIEEYADEFGRRLSNAAESRIGGGRRLGLFLSAGLDSRAVAGALHRSGSKFCTFTFARPHSSHHPDVVYARHIAKIYGCEHHEIAYTDDMFGEALPRAVWRTECAIPFAHSVSIQLHKAMMPHADWVFNGHFGGAFTRSDPRLFLCRNRKDVLRHIIKNRAYLKPPALGRIFRREFLKEHYNEMVCSIDRNLIEIGDARPPMLYNLWEKTAQCRWTFSSPAIDRYLFEQLSLYIDNDVLDWSLQIPLRYLFLERGFKLMILRTFPQIKEVPWARTKRPIPANLWRDCVGESFRAARFLTRRGLRKFIHSLKRQEPSIAQMHKRIRSSIERLYDSNGFDEKIFDIKNIRSMVMRHFDGQSVFWEEIELLATLAEGNRLFIERHCYEPPDDVQPVL
jgi:asparagine synthase (glutamine-hydrolysing)